MIGKYLRHRLHRLRVRQHAGLERIGADIAEHMPHLQRNEIRRHREHAVHAQSILRGDGSDGGGGKPA
jgi:hypothetical protein